MFSRLRTVAFFGVFVALFWPSVVTAMCPAPEQVFPPGYNQTALTATRCLGIMQGYDKVVKGKPHDFKGWESFTSWAIEEDLKCGHNKTAGWDSTVGAEVALMTMLLDPKNHKMLGGWVRKCSANLQLMMPGLLE